MLNVVMVCRSGDDYDLVRPVREPGDDGVLEIRGLPDRRADYCHLRLSLQDWRGRSSFVHRRVRGPEDGAKNRGRTSICAGKFIRISRFLVQ